MWPLVGHQILQRYIPCNMLISENIKINKISRLFLIIYWWCDTFILFSKKNAELLGECPFDFYSDNSANLFNSLGMMSVRLTSRLVSMVSFINADWIFHRPPNHRSSKFDAGDPKTQGRYITQSFTNTVVNSLVVRHTFSNHTHSLSCNTQYWYGHPFLCVSVERLEDGNRYIPS
jgi:hypothetical protein